MLNWERDPLPTLLVLSCLPHLQLRREQPPITSHPSHSCKLRSPEGRGSSRASPKNLSANSPGDEEQCERFEGHPDLTAENPSGALLYAHGAFGPLRSARVTGWGHFYSCLLTERLQAKGRGDLKAPACIRSHAQKRSGCPCSRRTASLCHIHSHRVTSGCLGLKNWDIEAHLSLQSKRKRKEESENQDICKKKGSQTNKPPRIQ